MDYTTELTLILLGIVLLIIIIPLLIGILIAYVTGVTKMDYYFVVTGTAVLIWLVIGLYYYQW